VLTQFAGYGERIVLADQANCVSTASCVNQRNITRNINACRAKCHAGYGLVQAAEAAVIANVLQIIITESDYAAQYHVGCFKTDGAVCGILDDSGCLFNEIYGVLGSSAVHDLLEENGKLRKTYTAGYTLTAGLCMAQLEK
jgi:hypothetical protein